MDIILLLLIDNICRWMTVVLRKNDLKFFEDNVFDFIFVYVFYKCCLYWL